MGHRPPDLRELLAPAAIIGEQALLNVFELEPDNKAFHQRVKTFAPLTPNLARSVAATYEARVIFDGRSVADAFLLQTKQRLDGLPLPHKATDDDIEAAAKRLAFDNRQTARLFLDALARIFHAPASDESFVTAKEFEGDSTGRLRKC